MCQLDRVGILRACAETASENAVDGLFAPLFWMAAGCLLAHEPDLKPWRWPGCSKPQAPSFLGYRSGRLRWPDRGAGWMICSPGCLPAGDAHPAAGECPVHWFALVRTAELDGAQSSQRRSFGSHLCCAGVRLGGTAGQWVKTLLAADQPEPDRQAIEKILSLTIRLELWIVLLGRLSKRRGHRQQQHPKVRRMMARSSWKERLA